MAAHRPTPSRLPIGRVEPRQAEQQQKNGFPQAQRHEGGFSGTDHTQSDKALLPAAQLQGAQHEHRAQGQQGTAAHKSPAAAPGQIRFRIGVGVAHPGGILAAVYIRSQRHGTSIAAQQLYFAVPALGQTVGGDQRIHRQVAAHRPVGIVGGQHPAQGKLQQDRCIVPMHRLQGHGLPQLIGGPDAVQHRGGQRCLSGGAGQPSAEQLQLPTGEISLVHSAQRAKGKVLVVDKDRILRRTPHRSGGCLLHKGIGICGGQVVTGKLPGTVKILALHLHGAAAALLIAQHRCKQRKHCRQHAEHHSGIAAAAFQPAPGDGSQRVTHSIFPPVSCCCLYYTAFFYEDNIFATSCTNFTKKVVLCAGRSLRSAQKNPRIQMDPGILYGAGDRS